MSSPFPRFEYERRLALIQRQMADLQVELLIVDGVEAMTWLTGFGVSQTMWRCACVPVSGEPFLFVRSLDAAPARERAWVSEVVPFLDWDDLVQVLAASIRVRYPRLRQIACDFDSHSMTVRRFQALCDALAPARIVDFGTGLADARLVKSALEIECLTAAARVAESAMNDAIAAVRPGGTERDAYAAAAKAFMARGGDDGWVGPITAGRQWGFLHGHLHDDPLREGSVVHIEVIPKVRCYTTRLMRSVCVGKPSERQQHVARELVRIQDAQIAAMRPGARADAIDAIVREQVGAAGLREKYDNITGYTLGVFAPFSQRGSDFTRTFDPTARWVLEPGMAFHMYVSAEGIAFSESVLVTPSGPSLLTSFPRQLFHVSS